MADFVVLDASRYVDIGTVPASTTGTSATSGAANTKGAWAQLTASTAFDSCGLWFTGAAISGTTSLFDLGIGAAGSEQVLISDICFLDGSGGQYPSMFFPIVIPSGTRVAVRFQSATASTTTRVVMEVVQYGFAGFPKFHQSESYGAVETASTGTVYTDPLTSNTKGAWVQLVASTVNAVKALAVMVNNQITNRLFLLDIGIGAAGSEQVLVPNLFWAATGRTISYLLPVTIPPGTRIAVRAQDDGGAGATFNIMLAGFN